MNIFGSETSEPQQTSRNKNHQQLHFNGLYKIMALLKAYKLCVFFFVGDETLLSYIAFSLLKNMSAFSLLKIDIYVGS